MIHIEAEGSIHCFCYTRLFPDNSSEKTAERFLLWMKGWLLRPPISLFSSEPRFHGQDFGHVKIPDISFPVQVLNPIGEHGKAEGTGGGNNGGTR